ncbi:MAG: HlyD family secretion protein [Ignavibacteriae bacterium]|nr:MAG: HlyD family secretion protein [Ignavibacteriota bacterium]
MKSKTVKKNIPLPAPEIPQEIKPVVEVKDEEPIETVPMYKNVKVVIPLFLVVLAISIFAWNYYIQLRDFVSTDDAYIDADRVSVSAKILGRIDQLTAEEGDSVRQGQVLVQLDDSDLRAQETQAKASLSFAHENVLLAQVNLQKAEADYQRASTQFHGNIIPKEQYDHAESEFASSRARLNIARAQVVSAQSQLGVIQTQLSNTIIASPMTGVISKRWALTGDVVQPGQAIFTIYNVKDVWVTANLEETALGALRLGDTVDIKVDTYPNLKFGGTILRLGSNTASQFSLIPPNNASGNFTKVTQRVPIKISVEQFSGSHPTQVKLLPGMSVEVKVKVR